MFALLFKMDQLLDSLEKFNTLLQHAQAIRGEVERLRALKSEEDWEKQSSSDWGLLLDLCSDLESELD